VPSHSASYSRFEATAAATAFVSTITAIIRATINNTDRQESSMMPRSEQAAGGTTTTTTVLESEVLLRAILSFVPDTFRFTTAVNRRFRQTYWITYNGSQRTSCRNALQAVETAQIWAAEQRHEFPFDWAARYGAPLAVFRDLRRCWDTLGRPIRAPRQPPMAGWMSCNGLGNTGVLGMPRHAPGPPKGAGWTHWSGRANTGATGRQRLVLGRPKMAIGTS
jgi:hypothetical protein